MAAEDDTWFSCRALPYRTKKNHIEGVVITFADISAHKRAEHLANAARSQAENANFGKSRFLTAASHDPAPTFTDAPVSSRDCWPG